MRRVHWKEMSRLKEERIRLATKAVVKLKARTPSSNKIGEVSQKEDDIDSAETQRARASSGD
jgi:hypothetical protein